MLLHTVEHLLKQNALVGGMLIQEHPEGSRLPGERQVAERLGVSRPLVREALRGLAERGLVEVVPGRGTFTRRVRTSDRSMNDMARKPSGR